MYRHTLYFDLFSTFLARYLSIDIYRSTQLQSLLSPTCRSDPSTCANFRQVALRMRPRHYRSSLTFDHTGDWFFFQFFLPFSSPSFSSSDRFVPINPDRFPAWNRERACKRNRSNVCSDARERSSATSFVRSSRYANAYYRHFPLPPYPFSSATRYMHTIGYVKVE